jgi:catechol 2,3-dioxygenase-like lactoylglutathione lyase family enzyme
VLDVRSVTFGIRTRDVDRARDWYAGVLGRRPDLAPAPGVYEWRLAGGAWLQLLPREAASTDGEGDGAIVRIGVAGLDRGREDLAAAGARLGEVERIPGVIAFCDVEDPFGNVLSVYEDLTEG